METIEVTSLSTGGQVVIPQHVRTLLGLEPGDKFVVVGEGDTVMLKRLAPPKPEAFDALCKRARHFARARGLTKRDLERAIRRVRSR
ncbi:MAG: AbrB/MazE/SpoVT family DNA-binding domain-containing protein [Planctomycetes bacterium]|nr:AbrB/MazE/SpoVT family DNA-binding domain-containing protein [Planctomycetota bacterium]